MRLLADENTSGGAVNGLRSAGHDVLWMVEQGPGTPDSEVMRLAVEDSRVLLTFDTDFGRLIFQKGQQAPPGLILFTLPPLPPADLERIVVSTVATREDWFGLYAVADERRVRFRALPSPP